MSRNLDPVTGRFKAADQLRLQYGGLGVDRAREVVVQCGSGITACHDLLALERAGHTGMRLYVGSWSEWIRDPDRPVATG
jgi:thiosulfate/3-mercaptopyruvate sulfurtransferase